MNPFHTTCAIIILVGSVLIFLSAFSPIVVRWARVALILTGLSGIADGVLNLIRLRYYAPQSHTALFLEHYRTLFAGVALGLLLTFFLSGEATATLRAAMQRRRHPKEDK
jgi:hypothetical protein